MPTTENAPPAGRQANRRRALAAIGLATIALLAGWAALWPPGLKSAAWRLLGALHPAVVHFPIVLVLAAAAIEWATTRRGRLAPHALARGTLAASALCGAAAVILGFADADFAGHQGTTAGLLADHRTLGLGTLAATLVGLGVGWRAARHPTPGMLRAFRGLLLLAAVAVGITGHLGALLVHGPESIDDALSAVIAAAGGRAAPAPASRPSVAGAPVDFAADIQPLLARRCYSCHAGAKPEAGLALDSEAGLRRGGKSGRPAALAGDPDQSEIIRLIQGGDPKRLMPPKGGQLAPDQVDLLRRWVAQGARWTHPAGSSDGDPWHWAYRAPRRANPPAVLATDWPRNALDPFVLARIEQAGLQPSPEADRATLIRRVSLDLTGLPPSPAEVQAFVTDRHPAAYDRLVDRLLASPHFGERWARLWLDLARYADTNGYEKDDRRTMWPYRDWVIDAFNRDLPFDQFTIEQLAGDQLPDATLDQRIATGFHRNTMINEEGGVDPEEFRVEAVADRVSTTASTWLGMTIGCARCHDHKHDPLTQRDYYSLFAIFNDDAPDATPHATGAYAGGPRQDVPFPAQRAAFDELTAKIARVEQTLATTTPALGEAAAAWEHDARDASRPFAALHPRRATAKGGADLTIEPTGTIAASGRSADQETFVIECDPPADAIAALRVEVFPDAQWNGDLGRSDGGNAVITNLRLEAATGDDGAPRVLAIQSAWADFEQNGGPHDAWRVADAFDQDPHTGWGFAPRAREPHVAVFRLSSPTPVPPGGRLLVTIAQDYGGRHTLRRLRLSVTTDPAVTRSPVLPERIGALLAANPHARTAAEAADLAAYFRSIAPALDAARAELAALHEQRRPLIMADTLVMRANPTPRETHLHIRGSFLNPGERVRAAVPRVLPPLPDGVAANRLALARWLVDGRNPLTARVTVNRWWAQLFGRGIVETDDDFGVQGDAPSNPALLDWLATEFVRKGWSTKELLRLIVTSATYRQTAALRPDLAEKDPENRLLARAPRFRLEAEMIRDVALTASGLLAPKVGGPSVFPPQPAGVWSMIYNSDRWVESEGADRYRRGVYTFWRRTAPYPAFTGFDAPSREISCTRRPRTNTPLQALTTLNDPAFVEAAGALAQRMLREGGATAEAQISFGFQCCTGRLPTAAEQSRLVRLLADERAARAASLDEAAALLRSARAGETNAPADLAAMIMVANVLLNLDETLTKG